MKITRAHTHILTSLPEGHEGTLSPCGNPNYCAREKFGLYKWQGYDMKSTGRPLQFKKEHFSQLLAEFIEHLQVAYQFIRELGNFPLLNMVDWAMDHPETSLMLSPCKEDFIRMLKTRWFDTHGPPSALSGDPEFNKGEVHALCAD